MQFPKSSVYLVFASLVFSVSLYAQEKSDREVVVHKNVKLIALAPDSDIPEDIAKQYRSFIPVLEEALKQNTADETDECGLTLRVTAGVKEIGSAKVKRPTARIGAYRRSSRQEYQGVFILHSYVSGNLVNLEETTQFLKKQILEPATCAKAE
jgi:hypothetical protein